MKTMRLNLKSYAFYTRKNANRNIFSVLIIGLLFIGSYNVYSQERSQLQTLEGINDALKRSANYLVKHTKDSGMFDYRLNMNPHVKVKKKYNILRHAGTIYAMSMYYGLQPDENLRMSIERAGRYLQQHAIGPIEGKENMLGIWSKPEVNGTSTPPQVKLGGVGLGLVALLSIEKFHPGFTPQSDLKALGQFIVFMQKEDGSFYSKYIPSLKGRQDKWLSLYYPGEAALGLLMLYKQDPSEVWLKSAYRALKYLALRRKNRSRIPADHWALLATEQILSRSNHKLPISKELLINHAIQICETMLRDQVNNPYRPKYEGGFVKDGRTTPTATRLEGLLAALSFLPPKHEIRKRIESSVTRGLSFLLKAQVKDGPFSGAIPRAVGTRDGRNAQIKKFNRRAYEVRIDYVQHAMSAMIQYLHFMK
jgi:hypothetical protein